ncbi:MAG: hypothetical protein ACLFP8_04875 [Alphaproteobacteria bacterium]
MISSALNLRRDFGNAVDAVPGIDLRRSFNTMMAKMDGLAPATPSADMENDLTLG